MGSGNFIFQHYDMFLSGSLNGFLSSFEFYGIITYLSPGTLIGFFLALYLYAFFYIVINAMRSSAKGELKDLGSELGALFYKSHTDNIFFNFLFIVIIVLILLIPTPMVLMTPILQDVSGTNVVAQKVNSKKQLIGWVINDQKMTKIDNQYLRVAYVPLGVALPLKYIEKMFYGWDDNIATYKLTTTEITSTDVAPTGNFKAMKGYVSSTITVGKIYKYKIEATSLLFTNTGTHLPATLQPTLKGGFLTGMAPIAVDNTSVYLSGEVLANIANPLVKAYNLGNQVDPLAAYSKLEIDNLIAEKYLDTISDAEVNKALDELVTHKNNALNNYASLYIKGQIRAVLHNLSVLLTKKENAEGDKLHAYDTAIAYTIASLQRMGLTIPNGNKIPINTTTAGIGKYPVTNSSSPSFNIIHKNAIPSPNFKYPYYYNSGNQIGAIIKETDNVSDDLVVKHLLFDTTTIQTATEVTGYSLANLSRHSLEIQNSILAKLIDSGQDIPSAFNYNSITKENIINSYADVAPTGTTPLTKPAIEFDAQTKIYKKGTSTNPVEIDTTTKLANSFIVKQGEPNFINLKKILAYYSYQEYQLKVIIGYLARIKEEQSRMQYLFTQNPDNVLKNNYYLTNNKAMPAHFFGYIPIFYDQKPIYLQNIYELTSAKIIKGDNKNGDNYVPITTYTDIINRSEKPQRYISDYKSSSIGGLLKQILQTKEYVFSKGPEYKEFLNIFAPTVPQKIYDFDPNVEISLINGNGTTINNTSSLSFKDLYNSVYFVFGSRSDDSYVSFIQNNKTSGKILRKLEILQGAKTRIDLKLKAQQSKLIEIVKSKLSGIGGIGPIANGLIQNGSGVLSKDICLTPNQAQPKIAPKQSGEKVNHAIIIEIKKTFCPSVVNKYSDALPTNSGWLYFTNQTEDQKIINTIRAYSALKTISVETPFSKNLLLLTNALEKGESSNLEYFVYYNDFHSTESNANEDNDVFIIVANSCLWVVESLFGPNGFLAQNVKTIDNTPVNNTHTSFILNIEAALGPIAFSKSQYASFSQNEEEGGNKNNDDLSVEKIFEDSDLTNLGETVQFISSGVAAAAFGLTTFFLITTIFQAVLLQIIAYFYLLIIVPIGFVYSTIIENAQGKGIKINFLFQNIARNSFKKSIELTLVWVTFLLALWALQVSYNFLIDSYVANRNANYLIEAILSAATQNEFETSTSTYILLVTIPLLIYAALSVVILFTLKDYYLKQRSEVTDDVIKDVQELKNTFNELTSQRNDTLENINNKVTSSSQMKR
jgi:hypothetical protein